MAQTPTQRLAASVRAEIARADKSGREVALALGWSPSSFSRRVNGRQDFTVPELMAIAGLLDIPLERFLRDTALADTA
jgi:transcriptional regulator with XRE-family HTH domain